MTQDDFSVRTTLDIDDDVLQAANELAMSRRRTTGQMLSELARAALRSKHEVRLRNGVPVLPPRASEAPRPAVALVNSLRD